MSAIIEEAPTGNTSVDFFSDKSEAMEDSLPTIEGLTDKVSHVILVYKALCFFFHFILNTLISNRSSYLRTEELINFISTFSKYLSVVFMLNNVRLG